MLRFLKSAKFWQVAVAVFITVIITGQLLHWRRDVIQTSQCDGLTLVVNDSTTAQCAKLRADKQSLAALQQAAHDLHGDLVAGTKVIIKHDTITKTIREVVTVVDSGGTRTATLADTTQDYQVRIDAEAPPTGNLKLGYTVITPEREIQVGFVKRSDGYYAVASGRGVRTAESFFTPEKERPIGLVAGGALRGGPKDNLLGVSLRYDAYAALQYGGKTHYQLRVGHDGSPYVGIAVEKRFW